MCISWTTAPIGPSRTGEEAPSMPSVLHFSKLCSDRVCSREASIGCIWNQEEVTASTLSGVAMQLADAQSYRSAVVPQGAVLTMRQHCLMRPGNMLGFWGLALTVAWGAIS